MLDATLETDQLAAQQGNDIHRIGDELRRRQMVSGRRVVRLPKREPEVPSLCSPPINDRFGCLRKHPFGPSRTLQKHWKTPKSSVPVLSAQEPWLPQVFLHFWPIALEFCSAHATRCMAPAALHFASRTENRVVFRVALGRQYTGVLHVPVWQRSTPVEAVGFELSE